MAGKSGNPRTIAGGEKSWENHLCPWGTKTNMPCLIAGGYVEFLELTN